MSDRPTTTIYERPLIGISMGDPLGIGPEVIVKALHRISLRGRARFVIFGQHEQLELAADQAEINPFWWREPYDGGPPRVGTGVLVADFDDLPAGRMAGERGPDELAGHASMRFLEEAIRHLKSGMIEALVTAPICKESWALANYRVKDHTELLAQRFETRRVTMVFVAEPPRSEREGPPHEDDAGGAGPPWFQQPLRVALASTHVPLFELRHHFTIGLVQQPIDNLNTALKEWFGIERPRIGVLGVNPHAGEGGLIGDEETRIIEPALGLARAAGINASGPLPPDTAFTPHMLRRFDGLVAMYHDQGLIPLKMVAFDRAAQVTLGLPAIRTSVDHGTAFDIAGRNLAHPGSMAAAIDLAIDLATQRRERRLAGRTEPLEKRA